MIMLFYPLYRQALPDAFLQIAADFFCQNLSRYRNRNIRRIRHNKAACRSARRFRQQDSLRLPVPCFTEWVALFGANPFCRLSTVLLSPAVLLLSAILLSSAVLLLSAILLSSAVLLFSAILLFPVVLLLSAILPLGVLPVLAQTALPVYL